jgi:ATP-dependent Clp protease adaptor protein ClpS
MVCGFIFGMAASQPVTEIDPETILRNLPPWIVILHNDDHNTMDHVVRSLQRCVPGLSEEEAVDIMYMAHDNGEAVVTACPKETAELYRERLEGCGLTSTIEPA